jgi:serine/threonine protein kinase/Tol biopolymer transport system component
MLTSGTRIGSYEIVDAIGAGGMGEVYRARDTKLRREVAIKILPEMFAGDPDRVARFQREAELLATLNHPGIAAIYGVDDASGPLALVLELVAGETLADRIERGALPLDDALAIARQLVDALEAAHDRGVVHRDLKPANIKVGPDGTVKVLDFGLAKITDAGAVAGSGPAAAPLSMSPTLGVNATGAGMILGTAAYMAPEQARGKLVDRRADIWAFGCVLFEMLTGTQTFGGDTVSDAVAAILRGDVDWSALPADTPPAIVRLLRRCLEKDPQKRLPHIGVVRLEIDEALSDAPPPRASAAAPPPPRTFRRERGVWLAVAVVGAIAAALVARTLQRPPEAPSFSLEVTTPATADPLSFAISPDGASLVFAAQSAGAPRLWVRSLETGAMRALGGTEDARNPFWSPDSRSIGFVARAKLKRIDLDSGSIRELTNAVNSFGGTWNRDGVIVFSGNAAGPLMRVAASGGAVEATTVLAPGQLSHRSPSFLPDGRHFLFYATGPADARGVYVGQLDGSAPQRLFEATSAAIYSANHLLYVRESTLFAQAFDPARVSVNGAAIAIANDVNTPASAAACSASDTGVITYRPSAAAGLRQLTWSDRSGKELGRLGDLMTNNSVSLSPDGSRAAVSRVVDSNPDIWLFDVDRGRPLRLTSDPAIQISAIWSPDGSRVTYQSHQDGPGDLYDMAASGAHDPPRLLFHEPEGNTGTFPNDWSPDGAVLLFQTFDRKTRFDIWALPQQGDRKPFPVVRTQFDEKDAQFSPDGKWIAYSSDESGRMEIYAQRFPGPGGKIAISTSGGAQARWRRDGRELFYLAPDNRLMAVPISWSNDTIDPGAPVALFATHVGSVAQGIARPQFAVTADGQRFLLNTLSDEANLAPITVVVNWARRARDGTVP